MVAAVVKFTIHGHFLAGADSGTKIVNITNSVRTVEIEQSDSVWECLITVQVASPRL